MSADQSSRFATSSPQLAGWLAAFSLCLNLLTYLDKRAEAERERAAEPTFSYEIATYDTQGLPGEFLDFDTPVRHNFRVTHRSGRAVEDFVLAIKSPGQRFRR